MVARVQALQCVLVQRANVLHATRRAFFADRMELTSKHPLVPERVKSTVSRWQGRDSSRPTLGDSWHGACVSHGMGAVDAVVRETSRQRVLFAGGAGGIAFAIIRVLAWAMPEAATAPWALSAAALSIFIPGYLVLSSELERNPLDPRGESTSSPGLGQALGIWLVLAWLQALLQHSMVHDPPRWLSHIHSQLTPWTVLALVAVSAFTGGGRSTLFARGVSCVAGLTAAVSLMLDGPLRTQLEGVSLGISMLWVLAVSVTMCLFKMPSAPAP